MKAWILITMAAALLAAGSNPDHPAPTGKIAGCITDESGQPIPGGSVIIDSTSMGAAANFDGSYIILNIPPGKYTLIAQTVGYNKMTVKDVVVTANSTTVVDFKLTATALKVEDIIVAAEEKTIDKYVTGNEQKISGEKIKTMPVANVGDVLRTTPGFTKEGGVMHSRGGRAGETTYMIEGKEVRDCLGGYGQALRQSFDVSATDIEADFPYFGPSIRVNSDEFITENYARIYDNKFLDAKDNPLSTFSIDVDAASYSNIRRFINEGRLPPADAVRIEEMVNYFTYDYPWPDGDAPFSVTTEISDCPWMPEHRLIHIGLQGKKIHTEDLPASNLVFLIDVSGSMMPANKLPLLKQAFMMLVHQLRPEDRVAMVVYAGAAGLVLQSTGGNEKQKIKDALNRLSAGGCTAGGAGMKLAYEVAVQNLIRGGNNRVIWATDGDFNVGASSDAEMTRMIEERREQGVFLSMLGFGEGNLKDSRMEQIADKGNGNYNYIDNIMEGRKVLVNQMAGTLFTIAKDVKLQVEFNPARVKAYRLIGYENRVLAKEDFNDDKKDAGEMGAGHTVTALYEIVPAGSDEVTSNLAPLKYQKTRINRAARRDRESLTINIRYKESDGKTSRLLSFPATDGDLELERSSDNFRFAASVAEFGMLLRDSEFKGEATFAKTLELAKGAKGPDREGYRAEFIRLVETCQAFEVVTAKWRQ